MSLPLFRCVYVGENLPVNNVGIPFKKDQQPRAKRSLSILLLFANQLC